MADSANPAARPATPEQIRAYLSERIIGQASAVTEVAIALAKRLAGVHSGNILMIGASGMGKTTVMRSVEYFFAHAPEELVGARRPLNLRIHANVLGREAERGRSGQLVLHGLLDQARRLVGEDGALDILQAAGGVVFVDEVDKIRASVGEDANVTGIRAQESLLTLMENESVVVDSPPWLGDGRLEIDSRRLLFVAGGAFEGLYDAVYDRVTVGEDRGALQPVTVVEDGQVREELPFRLADWLRAEDLFEYGMTPQFLSRFESTVLLEDLAARDLVRILLEAPDSPYLLARSYFAAYGIELVLSPSAAQRIATIASSRKRIGARALREVTRSVLRPYEVDPPSRADNGSILIDEPDVVAALEPG